LKTDSSLNKFIAQTNEFRKSLSETRVSLNEEIRKKEMEESDRKSATSSTLNTRIRSAETQTIEDLSELEDEYLREGLLVLSDLIKTKIG
jgi:carboxyl-terminal processing protease